MSFYIQPIYTTSNQNNDNQLFVGWVSELNISDNYNNLFIEGSYMVKSNSYLPVYSYYLDVNTDFGQALNIPLFFHKNVKNIIDSSNSNMLYTIDEYKFSFNLNLQQSSYFNEYINSKIITFNIAPMLNQSVINDFNVKVSNKDLQNFIIDINKSKQSEQREYANLLQLNPGFNSLFLSETTNPVSIPIDVVINLFDPKKIFNEFISFNNMNSELNIIDAKITLTPLNGKNKVMELNIIPKLYTQNSVNFNLNRYITYDKNNGSLNEQLIPGISGIFINENITIHVEINIKFEYMKCIRTILSDQYLNFDVLQISQQLNKLNYTQDKNIYLKEGYYEIYSEKIF